MNVPADLKYTKEHEWVKVEGNVATVGITDYAQGELGDIVFVELPDVDASIRQLDSFGTFEAVKAVSDLFAPLSGRVTEVNRNLETDPMIINRDPYGEGWMLKLEVADSSEVEQLMDAAGYNKMLSE